MRIMAVGTGDFPFKHGVVVGEVELSAFVQVALKTDFRRAARVDDSLRPPTGLRMQTPGTMATLTTNAGSTWARCQQARVRCRWKPLRGFLVAGRTFLRANE